MAGDLSRTTVTIWIAASPRKVFESWTRADILARWFQHEARNIDASGTSVGAASAGDAYEWKLVHGHVSHGSYLEVQADTLIRLTFGPDRGMSFAVELEPCDDGTLVKLTHEGMPADDVATHVDVKTGWTFYLANLKAWHEHGIDLREHEPDRIRDGVLNI